MAPAGGRYTPPPPVIPSANGGVVPATMTNGLVLPPKKSSPPPYSHAAPPPPPPPAQTQSHVIPEFGPNFSPGPPVISHPTSSSVPPPPPQPPPLFPDASVVVGAAGSSFTNTFLRGILTSIDSKDPIVANAWLETLLDAIDLLSPDVIKTEILPIATAKGQLSQSSGSRKASARLLGKVATKLETAIVQQEVLPTAQALCQDVEPEVRHGVCRNLGFIARGSGLEATKASILPLLVELGNDENGLVRLAAVETVVHLLSMLDDDTCTQVIVPLVVKSCDQAKQLEDEFLPHVARLLGRLCHGLLPNLTREQKTKFVEFYRHLSRLGLNHSTSSAAVPEPDKPMPDLVPKDDKHEMYEACRREGAFNFPALILVVGPENFADVLYPTFSDLACDSCPAVRRTLASSLHEIAKLVGTSFAMTKVQVSNLFADNCVEVLEAMIGNLVHVIDALARYQVLQFGQTGQYSEDLSAALLKCENIVSKTRNWRLHADCLEKFSCLANCISSLTIQQKYIPMLFERILRARALPCRQAAARTLLVILRFTIRGEDRAAIMRRVSSDLARGASCHTRMLFLKLGEMSIMLFSREYFKANFFHELLALSGDVVANVRHKLCTMLARLKSLLYLPSDRAHLQKLEETVKDLLLRERDRDVSFALQAAIEELDRTEMGVDGVPSMNAEEDRENDRKLREERLISSMEEQMNKIHSVESSPQKDSTTDLKSRLQPPRLRELQTSSERRRSESLPPSASAREVTGAAKQRFNSPEPSKTYSGASGFRDTSSPSALPLSSAASTLDWKTTTTAHFSKSPSTPSPLYPSSSHRLNIPQFASSLENLDPSAKEFLVDAGVTLETTNVLSSASSMPNLSGLGPPPPPPPSSQAAASSSAASASLKMLTKLEGEFSKFLISNEEMKQYESEYQKASQEIKNQTAREAAAAAAVLAAATATASATAATVTGPPTSALPMPSSRQSRPESRLKPPSSSVTSRYTPGLLRPPQSSSSSVGSSVPTTSSRIPSGPATGSTTGLSRIGGLSSSKLSTGSDKIQGSIERLTVKWEAKRKNLANGVSGSEGSLSSTTFKLSQAAPNGHNRRAAIMEQRLQSIKQQGISAMGAPTAAAKLGGGGHVDDQVGRQAHTKLTIPGLLQNGGGGRGRSSEATTLMAFSASSGSDEDDDCGLPKSSSDELDLGRLSNRSTSDDELPPYPAVGLDPAAASALRVRLPMPPPPAPEAAEDMVTYVPPQQDSPPPSSSPSSPSSTAVMYPSSTSSSLIVKPITLSTSPPSSSSVLAAAATKGIPRHRRPQSATAAGQQSRLLPPRSLPRVSGKQVQQQHSPTSPPSPAPGQASITRPKQQLQPSVGRGQHQFGIKSNYLQHYNRSPPSSAQQHPPPPPPPPLRHHPSPGSGGGGGCNPSLSPQRRIDYHANGLSPPPPPPLSSASSSSGNGGSGRLMGRGGERQDDADGGSNEGSNTLNAFARRLPSPRYRQQQPRRPLSHQEQQWQQRQRAHPPHAPLPNGKSLSAENILDEGESSSDGSVQLSPSDDLCLNGVAGGGPLQYNSPHVHAARGMRNRDPGFLQQGASAAVMATARAMSSGTLEGRGRSSSPQKLVSAFDEVHGGGDHSRSVSSGNQRRSSGLRMMWQGPPQHASQQRGGSRPSGQTGGQAAASAGRHLRLGRASSMESAASKLNDKSRSPSPEEGLGAPPPPPPPPQKTLVGGGGVQSRLRKPLSTSSLHSAAPQRAQQGLYQQNQQRNSFGGGGGCAGGGGDPFHRTPQRAKSASNSPGASRTCSPPPKPSSGVHGALRQPQQVPRRSSENYNQQPPPPPRHGYGQQPQQHVHQQQPPPRPGFGYHQQPQHRSQPHLPSSSPSHHQGTASNRPASGGGGGRHLYSYQQSYQGRPPPVQQQQSNAAAAAAAPVTSHLRVPNGGRNSVAIGAGPAATAAGRHSSVGLPMPGFASGGKISGQRTM